MIDDQESWEFDGEIHGTVFYLFWVIDLLGFLGLYSGWVYRPWFCLLFYVKASSFLVISFLYLENIKTVMLLSVFYLTEKGKSIYIYFNLFLCMVFFFS